MYPLHSHGAWLNREGTGNTDVATGHFHRVVGFRVQPDPSDGHTHELTMLPCGAGAAQTTPRDGQLQLHGSDDLVTFLGAAEPPKFSLLPWLVGAVVVSGLVIGGVMLMRSDDE